MSIKPTDPQRRDGERPPRAGAYDPRKPWQNTQPRGNGDRDRADIERSERRFEALLGR